MITIVAFKSHLLVSFVSKEDSEKFADFQKYSMEDLQTELGKYVNRINKVAYLSWSAVWIVMDYNSADLIKYLHEKYPNRTIKFYDKPKHVVKLLGTVNLHRVAYYISELEELKKSNLLTSRRLKTAGLTKEDLERLEKELALKYKAALTDSEKSAIKNNWLKVKAELVNFLEIE